MRVTDEYGGGHTISTRFNGQDVVLVRIRPVGTLEMGEFARGPFSEDWVPELIEALQLAHQIASRDQPWRPWNDPDSDSGPLQEGGLGLPTG